MTGRSTRVLSERLGKWMLRLYPPLFFQRIRCVRIGPGYQSAEMRVARSIWTRNLNSTTFGGTIFSAADPVYALLYWQIFARLGLSVQAWLMEARVAYRKPAATALTLQFQVPEADIAEGRQALATKGKFVKGYRVEARDESGEVCAEIETVVYLRSGQPVRKELSGW